jgi:hypothetical protein
MIEMEGVIEDEKEKGPIRDFESGIHFSEFSDGSPLIIWGKVRNNTRCTPPIPPARKPGMGRMTPTVRMADQRGIMNYAQGHTING